MSFMLFKGIRSVVSRAPSILKPVFKSHALINVREMANHRHKKIIKLAKGYRGRSNRCYSVAKHRVRKARQYAYRDRKVKKRDFRTLWIQRINASCRMYGTPYSRFINHMLKTNIHLNRKVLADLAVTEPLSFRAVLEVSKLSLSETKAGSIDIFKFCH